MTFQQLLEKQLAKLGFDPKRQYTYSEALDILKIDPNSKWINLPEILKKDGYTFRVTGVRAASPNNSDKIYMDILCLIKNPKGVEYKNENVLFFFNLEKLDW